MHVRLHHELDAMYVPEFSLPLHCCVCVNLTTLIQPGAPACHFSVQSRRTRPGIHTGTDGIGGASFPRKQRVGGGRTVCRGVSSIGNDAALVLKTRGFRTR